LKLEAPPQQDSSAGSAETGAESHLRSSATAATLAFFFLLWVAFYVLDRAFPYLTNGSDIVMQAKIHFEKTGAVFPQTPGVDKIAVFGNSKVLAGFLPSLFDQMASADHLNVSSFNSGFPGSDEFLSEFAAMCAHGQAPNVILLTLPWGEDPPKRDLFHFIPDDHEVVDRLFPFRFFPRDVTSFLMGAKSHGGIVNFYRESRDDAQRMIRGRGYYLITEQSRFPGGRIPDDFHLATDTPGKTLSRLVDPPGVDTKELTQLVQQYHIHCYYVPYYLRIGEAAPAAARDEVFAEAVKRYTPCQLIGPDYFLYPNRFFSDQTHLDTDGARVYTQALFEAVKAQLHNVAGEGHAIQ
jgi:hypothetical protein